MYENSRSLLKHWDKVLEVVKAAKDNNKPAKELMGYMVDETNKLVFRLELAVVVSLWDKVTGPFQSNLGEAIDKNGRSGMLVREAKALIRETEQKFKQLLDTDVNQLAAALFADSKTSADCRTLFQEIVRPDWKKYLKFHEDKIRLANRDWKTEEDDIIALKNEQQRIETVASGGLEGMLAKFQKDTKSLLDLSDEFDDKHLILTNRSIESTFGVEKSIERREYIFFETSN